MPVGVLALQGDVSEHKAVLEKLGQKVIKVRLPEDLEKCSSLVIPGGESTTMSLLMKQYGLVFAIKKRIKNGMPVFGTCAGAILLAKKVDGKPGLLNAIDVNVERNGYGRQADSFETALKVKGLGKKVKVAFIRAPIISSAGQKAEVLASFNGRPVLVRQKNVFAATFHPEIENDFSLHKMFLKL